MGGARDVPLAELLSEPQDGSAVGPGAADGLREAVQSSAAAAATRRVSAPLVEALPRAAERALNALPLVGPVSLGDPKLPLWAIALVAGLALVWVGAVLVHFSRERR